jgi:hypothetical protein
MTREEILRKSIWTMGKLTVYSDFFQQEVRLDLFTSDYNLENTNEIISSSFTQAVNDFLHLSTQYKPLMQKLLYQHCLDCCASTSYGFKPRKGETEEAANLRKFGVKDEASALEKANLDHVEITENEFASNRYVKLIFYPEWESEHGCELILKNGELLDYAGESGGYYPED